MLKFLTHKLRTHSINEENYAGKDDENRDSGTESDEDIEEGGDSQLPVPSGERTCNVSPADTGCSMESPAPSDQHDPHSSEEELEVINGNVSRAAMGGRPPSKPLRAASVCSSAEKRKWSQIGDAQNRRFTPENEENMSQIGNLSPSSPCSPYLKCYGEDGVHIEHSGSSDDEVHHLLTSRATPVQFRTSPPLGAVKPERRLSGAAAATVATSVAHHHKARAALSTPPKLLHYEASPRKRTRHMRHAHIQRPYLDFEKMQQLKTRSVTPWQHTGDHAGELSVFCW